MLEAAGRPIVDWVVSAARASGIQKIVLVIGHGPFATENARTAVEHGARSVTFAVRRHGASA